MARPYEPGPSTSLSTNTPSQTPSSPVPEEDDDSGAASPELPLTMSASVMLADLPRDATAALASVGGFPQEKVVVKFKPVGAAPSLAQELCKISATRKFEEVCFKNGQDQLIVAYSMTPAFG
ncbi:hypothetical protein MHUMG1_00602 [Metarhizium humberi]|uniref:Autophagy-ubiquitin-like modifier atg-12 n=1 Tax=Metarhizium humberi TaxID=2596975 RepID=A0A9P8MJW6_9HYPO|nr:hypothetical protein MHUMG1_00602 [Metarhizium humberi]